MPIVVGHTPAKLLGDMAQNSGQFATGEAVHGMALQDANYALQARAQALADQRANAELQLQRDRMNQQDRWNGVRYLSQFELDKQRAAERMAYGQQQFGNNSTLLDKRQQGASDMQDTRIDAQNNWHDQNNATRQHGQDLRHQDAQARNDETTTFHAGELQMQQARAEALRNQAAMRMANGNPAQALQYRQQHDQAVSANKDLDRELRGMSGDIHSLESERSNLEKQLPMTLNGDDSDRIRARLNEIEKKLGPLKDTYKNRYMGGPRASGYQGALPTTPEGVIDGWNSGQQPGAPAPNPSQGFAPPTSQPAIQRTQTAPNQSQPVTILAGQPAVPGTRVIYQNSYYRVLQPGEYGTDPNEFAILGGPSGTDLITGITPDGAPQKIHPQADPSRIQPRNPAARALAGGKPPLTPEQFTFVRQMKAQGADTDTILQALQQRFGLNPW
jgi:hypothetical protein